MVVNTFFLKSIICSTCLLHNWEYLNAIVSINNITFYFNNGFIFLCFYLQNGSKHMYNQLIVHKKAHICFTSRLVYLWTYLIEHQNINISFQFKFYWINGNQIKTTFGSQQVCSFVIFNSSMSLISYSLSLKSQTKKFYLIYFSVFDFGSTINPFWIEHLIAIWHTVLLYFKAILIISGFYDSLLSHRASGLYAWIRICFYLQSSIV